jgi:hypothetical protein
MSSFKTITESTSKFRALILEEEFEVKDTSLFKRAIAYIEFKVKVSDDFITLPSLIDDVINLIDASQRELAAYKSEKNEISFTTAQTHILNAAKASSSFAQVQNQTENTYLIDALKSNDDELQRLKNQLFELQISLTNIKSESSELIKSLTQNFQKLVDGTDEAKGWKQQVADALERLETEFHHELYGSENGKKGWVASAKDIEAQLTSILNDGIHLGRIIGVDGLTKNQRQAQELSFMERVRLTCSALLSSMGLGASVGGYQERANSERLSGIFWTSCIFFIFTWLVFFNSDLVSYFDKNSANDKIYEFLLFRLIASLPFVAFMFFAGFKAKSHRTMELKYRQFALELATFEPNLQSVEEDIRGFAKLLFIQKTFGNMGATEKTDEITLENMKNSIESFKAGVDAVQGIVKK